MILLPGETNLAKAFSIALNQQIRIESVLRGYMSGRYGTY